MRINKYEKFLLIQINGLLHQILNGEITFEDAEYMLLRPRIMDEFKKYKIRKEFIDLYEKVMLLDALILFNIIKSEASKIVCEISQILKENIDVEMDCIEIKLREYV